MGQATKTKMGKKKKNTARFVFCRIRKKPTVESGTFFYLSLLSTSRLYSLPGREKT